MKRLTALFVAAILVMISASPASAQGLDDPIPEVIGNSRIAVALEPLADGFVSPVWGTVAPHHDDHLYVIDQTGEIWAIDIDSGAKTRIADLSSLLVPLGVAGAGSFDERGLLGIAFDPRFERNGYIYTFTSEPVNGAADFSTMPAGTVANHQAVVSRWRSTNQDDPAAPIDTSSRDVLLRIDEPQFNHNAGALEFGRDRMLYIALGDGGGSDDEGVGHGTGNGQDPTNPLGSILRIDPHGSNSANGQYGIPRRNPFVGTDNVEEIYAYGFRNPYRMSFDRETGQLWTGDVGQGAIEEVDIVQRGRNYGWNLKEGSFVFNPNGADPGFVTAPADLGTLDPVAEYDHDEGISVIGGFVYRGDDIENLEGRYVFGDFARSFRAPGRLLVTRGGSGLIEELLLPHQNGLGLSLLGFGQDHEGELYVMANGTDDFTGGQSGVVLKLTEGEAGREFEAKLDGDAEVPPVATEAEGRARLLADRRWTELRYRIDVENIEQVTQAHIHIGQPGENGGVVAFLFGPANPPVDVRQGNLVRGSLTADDLVGTLAGQPLSALLAEIQAGNAYVNVHTTGSPTGEVRGQIMHE